jgi:hypothetical protein
VYTFDMRLRFNVSFDLLHGIFDCHITVIDLSVVHRIITGDVPWYYLLLTKVYEDLLALEHDLIIGEIAADDYIAAFDERPEVVCVVWAGLY